VTGKEMRRWDAKKMTKAEGVRESKESDRGKEIEIQLEGRKSG